MPPQIKRIYDPATRARQGQGQNGRLAAEIAPNRKLRRWFRHDPAKWREFVKRYHAELAGHEELAKELLARRIPGIDPALHCPRLGAQQLRGPAQLSGKAEWLLAG